MERKLLLISAEARTAATVKQAAPGYALAQTADRQQALPLLESERPDLIILDHDLPGGESFPFFRQLRLAAPRTPVIMLAADNDIPLAVAAAKLGVADFLKKPLLPEQLRQAIDAVLAVPRQLPGRAGALWLQGAGAALENFYQAAETALRQSRNIALLAERGIDARAVAEHLHIRGNRPRRKVAELDLGSFNRPELEAHFWTTVQELMAEPDGKSPQTEEDRTGTLLLTGFSRLDGAFQSSILTLFRERKGKLDKEIVCLVALADGQAAGKLDLNGFYQLTVPPLRDRKEDLPLLLEGYLRLFAREHNKTIAGVAPDALALLALYDYPGNYAELADLLDAAVLKAGGGTIGLGDLPIENEMLAGAAAKRALASGAYTLGEARKLYEAALFAALLAKSGGDTGAMARFLDLPRTVLTERLAELNADPSN